MDWVRHLPSIVASTLLFGVIGPPLGLLVLLAEATMERGHPLSIGNPGLLAYLTALGGAVPAFATGLVAGILRIHIRSLLLLAFVMAPTGALITAIYLCALMMVIRSGVPLLGKIILVGAIAAFCCSFLLWRNRPGTIPPR